MSPEQKKKLTLTQRWFLFNIGYARVFGIIFAIGSLLITASFTPALVRGEEVGGGYWAIVAGAGFAAIGVGLYLGASAVHRWYRRQLSLDEPGPLLRTKREADAHIDKALAASVDRPRAAAILTIIPIGIAVALLIWQAFATYGWLEVAFYPLSWILAVASLVCTLLMVVRKRRWWLLLTAPVALYPLFLMFKIAGACSRGSCL
jgi:hypothetical protein